MISDRYILNRNFLNVEESNYWLFHSTTKEKIDLYRQTTGLHKQDVRHPENVEYINQLRRIFDINENRSSILPFVTRTNTSAYVNPFENHQWPVRPRHKPVHKSQLAVLDLPNIRNDICCNITDWASNNHLIAALGKVIWIWNVSTSKMFHHINCSDDVIALKADPEGKVVAYSCSDGGKEGLCALRVWDFETGKSTTKVRAIKCHHSNCSIISIDFHVSNKYLIVGCKYGNIGILDMQLNNLATIRGAHGEQEVIRIRASPDGRYFASSGYDGYVRVWNFADYQCLFSYYQPFLSRGLSWHPWRNSLLCIGSTNGRLVLVNVPLKKIIHSRREDNTIIYEATFNKLSAELVLSQTYCVRGVPESYRSQINVLADFNHVVDRFEGHSKRVLFLDWSPDGRILATAGSDETIHLWNFFEKKIAKKVTKINSLKLDLDKYIR